MQTQHYGFKLFEAAEKPTWLTDWNNTMNKIDSTIARLTGGGGDTPDLAELTQRVQALEGRVDSDELRLNVVEGDIVDMLQTLSDVQTALTTLETNTQQSLSDMSDDITDLSADLSTLSGTVTSLTTSLSTLSARVTDTETDISALDTRVTSAEGDITQNTSDISGLDTRVTALEQGGSLPALEQRVTTCETNITQNTSDISTNATNIAQNTADIATNTANIAQNTSDINAANADITALDTRLTTAEGNISQQASDITSIDGRVTTNTSGISSNTTAINGLDARVTALEGAGGGVTITKLNNLTTCTPNQLNSLLTDGGYDMLVIGGGAVNFNSQQYKLPTDIIDKDYRLATNIPNILCRYTMDGYSNVYFRYYSTNASAYFQFDNGGLSANVAYVPWVYGIKF